MKTRKTPAGLETLTAQSGLRPFALETCLQNEFDPPFGARAFYTQIRTVEI
jgi:hypothetical protein